MVLGLQSGGALLQLVERGRQCQTAGGVGLGAELSGQPLAQRGDLLGEAAGLVLGIGELDSQALLGDERARRQLPGPVPPGLALSVPSGAMRPASSRSA